MVGHPIETHMPADMVRRVLEAAPASVILVGGQALAYWIDYYRIPLADGEAPAITRDVDFFTPNAAHSSPLKLFARAIGGKAHVLEPRAVTALIGSAIAAAGDEQVYNVDLLHTLVGLEREHVDRHAVDVDLPGGQTLRVMHPLDVLKSRNANLHVLRAKRTAAGRRQLQLAIDVARAYLEDRITAVGDHTDARDRERAVLKLLAPVISYAGDDAARKNMERYGIYLGDAIPAWLVTSASFWKHQWPHLRTRMSPDYAALCEQRAGKAT